MFLEKKTKAAMGDWIEGDEGGSREILVIWTRVMAVEIRELDRFKEEGNASPCFPPPTLEFIADLPTFCIFCIKRAHRHPGHPGCLWLAGSISGHSHASVCSQENCVTRLPSISLLPNLYVTAVFKIKFK